MTDYEKAKSECKRKFLEEIHPGFMNLTQGEQTLFDYTFEQAYRYGRWTAMEEAKAKQSDYSNQSPDPTKMMRFEAAKKFLSTLMLSEPNNDELYGDEYITLCASTAVAYADALIKRLNRAEDNGNKD